MSHKRKTWFKSHLLLEKSSKEEAPSNLKKVRPDRIVHENADCDGDLAPLRKDLKLSSNDYFRLIEPKQIEDLCINTLKVRELKSWLDRNSGIQKVGRFLLITGPPGSGKSISVQVLCKHLKIEVKEWTNPTTFEENQDEFYVGITKKFSDFLRQATRFRSLDMTGTDNNNGAVVLVDDFPNSILHDPSVFQSILRDCASSSKLSIIFTCTEDSTSLMKTLFKQNIRDEFQIELINFNPVATSLLNKATKRIVTILQSTQQLRSSYEIPVKNVIESIVNSAMGDLRNVTLNFYFASIRSSRLLPVTIRKYGQFDLDNKDIVKPEIKEHKNQNKKVDNEYILVNYNKDSTLDIFHALGKILYAKRNKKNKLQYNEIEKIVDEYSYKSDVFVTALFNNYLDHFGDFDEAVQAVTNLSFSNNLISSSNFNDDFSSALYMWCSCLGVMVSKATEVKKWNPIHLTKFSNEVKLSKGQLENQPNQSYDNVYYKILKSRYSGE